MMDMFRKSTVVLLHGLGTKTFTLLLASLTLTTLTMAGTLAALVYVALLQVVKLESFSITRPLKSLRCVCYSWGY